MAITVRVPTILRSCCNGASELSLAASSVQVALQQIERDHPKLYDSICNETGALREHVNLFINSSLVSDKKRLDTMLVPGDVLSIYQAVSGG